MTTDLLVALVKAFSALAERERVILRGRIEEGRSLRDLARELHLHHSTVGRTYHRAIEKLRKSL